MSAGISVVTGGAGGIGFASARLLSSRGPVLLADLPGDSLEEAATALRGAGATVSTIACDIDDDESVAVLAEHAAECGGLATLVHAAGIAPPLATDPERIFRIDAVATARVLAAMLPLAGPGTVAVCIASVAGHRAFTQDFDAVLRTPETAYPALLEQGEVIEDTPIHAYSLAKRSVLLQVQAGAAAWGARGARLVSVSPGIVVDTAIGRGAATIHAGAYADLSAVGRPGVADDVARAVAFLASEAAAYITGVDLVIDGGVIAHYRAHAGDAERRMWEAASYGG